MPAEQQKQKRQAHCPGDHGLWGGATNANCAGLDAKQRKGDMPEMCLWPIRACGICFPRLDLAGGVSLDNSFPALFNDLPAPVETILAWMGRDILNPLTP